MPIWGLILIRWLAAVGVQTRFVRIFRTLDFRLPKFFWVVLFLLNVEWTGRVLGLPGTLVSYSQHLKESKILGTPPHFPFSLIDSSLFIFFYTGFVWKVFKKNIGQLGFWIQGMRAILVLGVLVQLLVIYVENSDHSQPLLENTSDDWMMIGGFFFLNLILSIFYFRLMGRFRELSNEKKI